jgi:tRNA pseudouridine55 synthase
MYSAKKIAGRKLYELARRGEEVERKPVRVTISDFNAVQHGGPLLAENSDGTKDLRARVTCSAGTYIRTLAEDFGKKLGVGAHVAELRRTRAGQFKIEEAITLERLQDEAQTASLDQLLISPDAALSFLPALQLEAEAERRVAQGIDLQVEENSSNWLNGQPVRMRNASGHLVAVGIYDAERKIVHPQVVIGN